MRSILRKLAHTFFGSRRWMERNVQRIAAETHDQRILELGSGRQDLGADAYSVKAYFDPSNEFIQSDVVPEHGHLIVDATTMTFEDEFEIILCLNVLEHVFEFQQAIDRIYRALRPGGQVLVQIPMFFPFHDEPFDFWRFTEHALRRMFDTFGSVEVKHRGVRQLPFSYFVVARKDPAPT